MNEEKWYYFLKNPFTILETIGTVISIVTYLQGFHTLGFIFLTLALVAISSTCVHYERTARRRKMVIRAFRRCPERLHDLIHEVRDTLTTENLLTISKDSPDWVLVIRRALTGLEGCFSEIINAGCHASIMLPDRNNPEKLVTTIRSLTVCTERQSFSTILLIEQGLAGLAFKTGETQWSVDFAKDKRFFAIRPSFEDFYLSGVSAPFRVNDEIYGVVNLDCERHFQFDKDYAFLVRSIADFIGFIYQIRQAK